MAAVSAALSLPARLLRGFATDFLTSHDIAEARRIMAPGYTLNIGGHVFGRGSSGSLCLVHKVLCVESG